jgi:hypothetical protein
VRLRPIGFTTSLRDLPQLPLQLSASPNPFSEQVKLSYAWENQGHPAELRVYNALGILMERHALLPGKGDLLLGAHLPAGQYWVQVHSGQGSSKVLTVVKQ